MAILNVARWWGLDPDIVTRWAMPDFTDRQEYMFVQLELEKPDDPKGLQPGETEWKGRQ